MTLTGRGVWSANLRYGDPARITEAAAELDQLGYSACWVPDPGGLVFEALDRLLDATTSVVAATGVLNVWLHTPEETLAWWDGVGADRRPRVLLGLSVGHAARIGETWGRPLAVTNGYLDRLDAGGFPAERRCLAALGPQLSDRRRFDTDGRPPGERVARRHRFIRSAARTR